MSNGENIQNELESLREQNEALLASLVEGDHLTELLDQKNPLLDRRYQARENEPSTPPLMKGLLAESKVATPQYNLDISQGAMEALLTVFPPAAKGKLMDPATLIAAIGKRVRVGLVEAAVTDALKEVAQTGKTVEKKVVARGTPPEAGRDSELTTLLDFMTVEEFKTRHPDVDLNQLEGSRDFKKVARVKDGEAVARFRKEWPGKPGATVSGMAITVAKGRCLHQIGPNLTEKPDPEAGWVLWVADAEGVAVLLGNRVAVLTFSEVMMKVSLEEGEYSAIMQLTPPTGLWKPPTLSMIQAAIAKEGIVYGLLPENMEKGLNQFLETGKTASFLVAQGVRPAEGPPATTVFHVDLEYKVLLREDALGRVDHKARRNVIHVGPQTLLCTLTHQDAETRLGHTVKNKTVNPRSAKFLPVLAGEGVEERHVGDRVLEYWSSREGEVVWNGKHRELKISQVKTVEAVDISLGHLTFAGDVVVTKNIEDGMQVSVAGDLLVKGQIMGARVDVKGHLTCEGGIHTGRKGAVICGGDLQASFIENSVIRCGGTLTVEKSILQSRIGCLGDLNCCGDKSQLVGGIAQVKGQIRLKDLGHDSAVQTIVHVGVHVEELEKYHSLVRRIKELQSAALDLNGENTTGLDDPLKAKDVLLKRKELLTEILAARTEAKALYDRLAGPTESSLVVEGTAHAHHVVRFGGESLLLSKDQAAVRFFQDPESREIRTTALAPKGKKAAGNVSPAPQV